MLCCMVEQTVYIHNLEVKLNKLSDAKQSVDGLNNDVIGRVEHATKDICLESMWKIGWREHIKQEVESFLQKGEGEKDKLCLYNKYS